MREKTCPLCGELNRIYSEALDGWVCVDWPHAGCTVAENNFADWAEEMKAESEANHDEA